MKLQDPKIKVRDRRAIREALDDIRGANSEGLLVPEEIVEAARDDDSPMHGWFTWDDTAAAKQWRLMQARHLIREIEVTFPDDKEEKALPKYVSLISDRKRPGGGYRETSQVMNSKKLLGELEDTAKRDVEGVLKRFELLKAFCARVRKAAGIKKIA